jgi:hypothetical protein
MAVLITYSESLQAHDSSEPFPDDMQACLLLLAGWSLQHIQEKTLHIWCLAV